MKQFITLILFVCLVISVQAQQTVYYYNDDFKSVKKEEKSSYIAKQRIGKKTNGDVKFISTKGADNLIVTFKNGKVVEQRIDYIADKVIVEEEVIEIPVYEQEESGNTTAIFYVVEEEPVPNGGYDAYSKFIADNLRYPKKGKEIGIEGRVFVQFVVNGDGSVSDIEVVRGLGSEFDEEAVRLTKLAAEKVGWKPGKQPGTAVRSKIVWPVNFKIN